MNKQRIDLHAHTVCSDGSETPEHLVEMAAEAGLAALAVTDHDTMAGVTRAMEAGKKLGLEVIPGIELSTLCEGFDVHMVGLFLDPEQPVLKRALEKIVENRRLRNERMVERLIAAGLPITRKDVEEMLAGGKKEDGGERILTRGNLAQILVDHGAASSVKEAMNLYLVKGKAGYVAKQAPTPEEAVRLVHEAGGLVFVAHFHQIDRRDPVRSAAICRKILAAGADGLETRYCEFTPRLQSMAEAIAEETGCLRSGGSDFHGKLKPGLFLGTGYGDLFVPSSYLDAMKERLDQRRREHG